MPANTENTALDAQVCASFASKTGSQGRWALIDATNGRYEPVAIALDKLTPEYPYFQIDLAANECVRGWIMIQTRIDQPIVTIRYQTGDGNILKWDVPAGQG